MRRARAGMPRPPVPPPPPRCARQRPGRCSTPGAARATAPASSRALGPSTVVVGLDYDAVSVAHATATYGGSRTAYIRGALTTLPLPDAGVDLVVSLQVLEHIWSPGAYVRELVRVTRPGGVVVLSTPNRLTFSPDLRRRERPANPFHSREYDPAELAGELARWAPRCRQAALVGVRHGPRLRAWESEPRPGRGGPAGDAPRSLACRAGGSGRRGGPGRLRADGRGPRPFAGPRRRPGDGGGLNHPLHGAESTAMSTGTAHGCRVRSPSSCTRTCPGCPATASGRWARSGSTRPSSSPTSPSSRSSTPWPPRASATSSPSA